MAALGSSLMVYRELPLPISVAMGDQVYLARHPDEGELLRLIGLVQERA